MSEAFKTDIVEIDGVSVKIEFFYDNDSGMPWVENDGCGIIRETCAHYGRPDKKAGEIILYSDRGDYWMYDFKATTEKAKAEGWGISGETAGLTKKQITRAAVLQDMEYCRKFLKGDLFYVGIVCTILDNEGEETESNDSCWGFEYGYYGNDSEYAESEAQEMAQNLARGLLEQKRKTWRAALHEARQRKYWACRDIITV